MYSNAFLSTNSAVITNLILEGPKRLVSKETPPLLGSTCEEIFLNFHSLELLKQRSLKVFVRNLKHHETMKSVYFETLRLTFRENKYSKETLMK